MGISSRRLCKLIEDAGRNLVVADDVELEQGPPVCRSDLADKSIQRSRYTTEICRLFSSNGCKVSTTYAVVKPTPLTGLPFFAGSLGRSEDDGVGLNIHRNGS